MGSIGIYHIHISVRMWTEWIQSDYNPHFHVTVPGLVIDLDRMCLRIKKCGLYGNKCLVVSVWKIVYYHLSNTYHVKKLNLLFDEWSNSGSIPSLDGSRPTSSTTSIPTKLLPSFERERSCSPVSGCSIKS
jgi:hypothetical protein